MHTVIKISTGREAGRYFNEKNLILPKYSEAQSSEEMEGHCLE